MNVHDLCGWVVTHCGQSRSATEYGNFEFHNKKTAPLQERFNSFCSLYLAVDDHALGQTLTIYVDAVEVQTRFEVGNVKVQGVLALNT